MGKGARAETVAGVTGYAESFASGLVSLSSNSGYALPFSAPEIIMASAAAIRSKVPGPLSIARGILLE